MKYATSKRSNEIGVRKFITKNDKNLTWDAKHPYQVFRNGKWVDIREHNNGVM